MQLPALASDRATQLVFAFPGVHILVVGDAMLDTFIVGRVTRISPEAPVPIVAFDHQTQRIGGAANVAHNVTALGGHATLIAVMGQDDNSTTLMRGCRDAGIETGFIATDSERVTTTKVRIVTERNQQVARVDYESDAEISGDVEHGILQAVEKYGAESAAIVVSDYLKGCVTRRVMEAVIDTAKTTGIPVLVDPKIPHIDYYAGTTMVTPNHHEAEAATHSRIRSTTDARLAAHAFRDRVHCESILMTRGDQGIWLLAKEAEGHLPALAREVADVTGAGDTVIAALALAMGAGASMVEAAHLANQAASISVGKFGAATVSPSELLRAVSITADA